MALSDALYTGLTGLDVSQSALNVIGNNIANINTTAFKASRAEFSPEFYVTSTAGTASTSTFGGTNPMQMGMGAEVAEIQQDFTPGTLQNTGKNTDMAVDGSGFFIVQANGETPEYTRDGSFSLNDQDQLVTSSGQFVQGFGIDGNANIVSGKLQNITIPLGTATQAQSTSTVQFQGNLNANGAVANGASILDSGPITDVGSGSAAAPTSTSLLTDLRNPSDTTTPLFSVGQTLSFNVSKGGRTLPTQTFTVQTGDTIADLNDFLQQSAGIDPTATEPTGSPTAGVSVGTLAGDAANTGHLIITGNTGAQNALETTGAGLVDSTGASPLSFADGTDAAGDKSNPTGESVYTSAVVYDSLGTPISVNITASLESKSSSGTVWNFTATSPDVPGATTYTANGAGSVIGNGTISFDGTGKLTGTTGTGLSIDRTGTGAATPLNLNLDFSQMTSLTADNSTLTMTKQDGSAIGTLDNFSVGADGTISGVYSNGMTRTLGQVAVATFTNPNGLTDMGGNLYAAGASSGVPVVTAPQQLGAGAVRSGELEQSNVDLSKEFTNMILASTGYTASSRVITTSDQLLTDLLNSSR